MRQVFFRPDRIRPFASNLPMVSLTSADGWCDDPTDPSYNRLIKIPYLANHEVLWRTDHAYDIIIVVGYNDSPPISPKGSAIFIHMMNDSQTPTDGCIALSRGDLLDILSEITPSTQLIVPPHLEQITSPLSSNPIQEKHL